MWSIFYKSRRVCWSLLSSKFQYKQTILTPAQLIVLLLDQSIFVL